MKFTIKLETMEMAYIRLDALYKIKESVDSAKFWKLEGKRDLTVFYLNRARRYRNIVKAIDNRTW